MGSFNFPGLSSVMGVWCRRANVDGMSNFNLLETDVVVCELSHLCIINTEDLCFFAGAEAETRDEMHRLQAKLLTQDEIYSDSGILTV
jgi:hypothetical protein